MRVLARPHPRGLDGPLAALAPLGLLASLVLTLTLLAACGVTTTTGTAGGSPTATTVATAVTTPAGNGIVTKIEIGGARSSGFNFTPATVTIKAGTTVTWTNTTGTPHTVTSDAGAPAPFDSGTVNAGGGTFSFTFTQPGSYGYHCNFHTYMQGTVVVTP
jgi:plastocyanin